MGKAILLLACMFMAPLAAAEELSIDDWEFTWNVVKSGDMTFGVEKTSDTTLLFLKDHSDWLQMRPAEAEEVGKILAKADEYFQVIANLEEGNEIVKGGKHVVTFNKSQHGLWIYVRADKQFSMSSVGIKKADAKVLAPKMLQAKALAALVDQKIKP